jgi:hypothetical protein
MKHSIPKKRADTLRRYLQNGDRRVQGWLNNRSAQIIAALSQHQLDEGLQGAVGEIGVHHGRLFLLLVLASREEDGAVAIDVFEQQELNVDRSGRGSRAIFERNLKSHGVNPSGLKIIAASSFDVSGETLRREVGPLRLFSIDGGHTPECIVNDLQIADAALAEHGVVIIDDVFNSTWPGVVTGYREYLDRTPRLVPFATSPNKVYACPKSYVDHYRGYFRSAFPALFDRSDQLFGFAVDGYGMWEKPQPSLRRRLKRAVARRLGRS